MTYAANDVVLGRHLDTAEKRIKREIDKIAAGGTSIAVFTGATATDGTSGLVPAPQAGDNGKFLRGDGTWATVESGSSGGDGYIIGSKVSSVEGGFWQGTFNDTPVLKLRHGDYEYNFAYDNLTFTGGASSVLETVTPNTYVLGTASVSNDGGVWYEVNNDVPTLNLHKGNFNYSFNYDRLTYKGDNSHLAAYLPFNVSPTADACGNEWTTTGNPTIVDGTLSLNSSSFLSSNSFSLRDQVFTIDFWANVHANGTLFTFESSGFSFDIANNSHVAVTGCTEQSSSPTMTLLNTRRHYALTFDGTNTRAFVDGILRAAEKYVPIVISPLRISNLQMEIDHFRVFKGQALWTSDFTPPTAEDYL